MGEKPRNTYLVMSDKAWWTTQKPPSVEGGIGAHEFKSMSRTEFDLAVIGWETIPGTEERGTGITIIKLKRK